jgi:hypothetical protein
MIQPLFGDKIPKKRKEKRGHLSKIEQIVQLKKSSHLANMAIIML